VDSTGFHPPLYQFRINLELGRLCEEPELLTRGGSPGFEMGLKIRTFYVKQFILLCKVITWTQLEIREEPE
jgi:hypothetical protein